MKIKLILCITLLFLSSCVTKALWGDKSYLENINQFLVGADGRYVALIGTDYHYVFSDNSGLLKEILSLRQKGILLIDTKKTHLKLYENNDIKGSIVIAGPFDILPPEDKNALVLLGVRPNRRNEISIKIDLTGKRYLSKYLGNSSKSTNTFYTIPIYYNDSTLAKDVGKAAVTPIAVTLDAILLIGKVVVAPLSL